MKSIKTLSRKRSARSALYELGGDLYAVDLKETYRPGGLRNSSWTRNRWRIAGNEDDPEEFSGNGIAAKPTSSNSLTPPAGLKVTHRCVSRMRVYMFLLVKRTEWKQFSLRVDLHLEMWPFACWDKSPTRLRKLKLHRPAVSSFAQLVLFCVWLSHSKNNEILWGYLEI